MAGKKINLADLVFKVSDDGTLKVFAGSAKKAGKELKNVEKQQDKTTYATKKGIMLLQTVLRTLQIWQEVFQILLCPHMQH